MSTETEEVRGMLVQAGLHMQTRKIVGKDASSTSKESLDLVSPEANGQGPSRYRNGYSLR